MPAEGDTDTEGRAGVELVKFMFNHDFKWLCREQFESDIGIDLQVETVAEGKGTGRLIAVQVKTGKSYLTPKGGDSWRFPPKLRHISYWTNHSLPVIVILVDTDERIAWWETFEASNLDTSGAKTALRIPKKQVLDPLYTDRLREFADADPYILRLRQMQLMRPWMKVLADGGVLWLEVEEWVNKTSGRADIKLYGEDRHGEPLEPREWPFFIFPFADYEVELPKLFPWAVLDVDEDHYYDYLHAEFAIETGIWDSEDKEFILMGDFADWKAGRYGERSIYPYEDDDEVAQWRLTLSLSELGQAFLLMDEHFTASMPALG